MAVIADQEGSRTSEIKSPVTTPRVSIIVPCHNGGRFLNGLLASLDAQTFRDFETIIVDDGSTEVTTREKLQVLSPAIRVVHQENRYLPAARNRGFLEARAELVLPLDCDDTLEPSYLAETVPILENAPADVGFVFTHVRLTDTLTGVLPRHLNRFDQLFLNLLPYCMLIRKSAWRVVGGYDETMRGGMEDWEFNIRLSRSAVRGIELGQAAIRLFCSSGRNVDEPHDANARHDLAWNSQQARRIVSDCGAGATVARDAAGAVKCLCRNRCRAASFGEDFAGNLVQQPVLLAAHQDPRATNRARRAADRRDAREWRGIGSESAVDGVPGGARAHRYQGPARNFP